MSMILHVLVCTSKILPLFIDKFLTFLKQLPFADSFGNSEYLLSVDTNGRKLKSYYTKIQTTAYRAQNASGPT